MKKYFLILIAIIITSCSNFEGFVKDANLSNGGFVVFEEQLTRDSFKLSLKDLDEEFSHRIRDFNGDNILSYELSITYGDTIVNNFITITSFPNTLSFSARDILTAVGLENVNIEDLNLNTPVKFTATVTTPNNVFNGGETSIDITAGTVTGGQSAEGTIIGAASTKQAMLFEVRFYIPPPLKIKGTSFEEPFGSVVKYTRNSLDQYLEAELFNNENQRNIAYTARGNGENDEIGFRTFVKPYSTSTSTRGFTDGRIGVINGSEFDQGAVDGVQVYEIDYTSWATITILFDKVAIDPNKYPETGVRINYGSDNNPATFNGQQAPYFTRNEFLKITAEVKKLDGSTENIVLLDAVGGNGLDESIADKWLIADSGIITNAVSYVLKVEVKTTSFQRHIILDDMRVYKKDDN